MIGIPYIKDLFLAILKNDLLIKGHFFICPKWGSEINNPNIDEQLAIGEPPTEKYPCVLMMPPRISNPGFQYIANGGQLGTNKFIIKLLFVTGARNTSENQVSEPNGNGMSTHTIVDTWHDMSRCAIDFMRVLFEVMEGIADFTIDDNSIQDIIQVTNIGNDGVSGSLLSFNLIINSGCDIETYLPTWKNDITVPDISIDTHPFHEVGI